MRECINEGVLQSYVDGELSMEMVERVEAHAARCSLCAEALDEAASEMLMFTRAFAADTPFDVPTVRLRERIDRAIAGTDAPVEIQKRKQGWTLSGWLAAFGELFKVSPQRAVGFASLIAVVAFAAIFATISLRRGENSDKGQPVIAKATPTPQPTASVIPTPTPEKKQEDETGNGGGPNNNSTKPAKQKKQPKEVLVPEPDQLPRIEQANYSYKPLPGEQNYLKAIDSLTAEIQASDATAMKPSLRAEYERNLAVVDQAIDSTRRAARRNPRDADAVQFLYSSYQSKLDLLSAVAEQVRPTIATR